MSEASKAINDRKSEVEYYNGIAFIFGQEFPVGSVIDPETLDAWAIKNNVLEDPKIEASDPNRRLKPEWSQFVYERQSFITKLNRSAISGEMSGVDDFVPFKVKFQAKKYRVRGVYETAHKFIRETSVKLETTARNKQREHNRILKSEAFLALPVVEQERVKEDAIQLEWALADAMKTMSRLKYLMDTRAERNETEE